MRKRRKDTRHMSSARFATVLLAVFAFLAAMPAGSSAYFWKVPGAGFGHGVGMSQYGAYGFARHGKSYRQILAHYYTDTSIKRIGKKKRVRVLLVPYQSSVRFKNAKTACGKKINPKRTYSAVRSGKRVRLLSPKGKPIRNCGKKLKAGGGKSFYLVGKGRYRGTLIVRASSVPGKVNAINSASIDQYVRGVVAAESPASWPLQALQAQAVAARSYALASSVGGIGFDLYDDTRSQVYDGQAAETKRTDIAVSRTAREVVFYEGEIATTFFFSTSGGHTENNENVFGGKPLGYLRGVPDPYDGVSPLHRWTKKFSRASMQSRLSGYVRGNLQRIQITKRGVSPRIVTAKLVGSRGTTTVSGLTLVYALGLYDSWASFVKK